MFRVFCAAIVLSPLVFTLFAAPNDTAKPAQSAQPAAIVVTSAVKQGAIKPHESYVGTLRYATLSKLAAESSAPLEQTSVETGDRVRAGQILARQESSILSANIAAKSAELKKSESGEEQAARDAERFKTLLDQNSVSSQTYEQYRLKALQESAQSEVLRSQLEAMRLEKTKRSIAAPFDGVVVERFASVGDYLSTGNLIVSLAKTDSIEAAVFLPAAAIERIFVGMRAIVSVSGVDYSAKIAGISPRGDSSSRTFLTRITFDKPTAKLLEGMQATLKIEGKSSENALLVDRDAIVERNGNFAVFFVSDSRAQIASVEILGYDGQLAAVRSAVLREGMQVVVKGNERIVPDQAVRAENRAEDADNKAEK
ncbi:RND transporter MFP subunit [Campylobacterota bacterium]|nr:RND transporter MFP subunit [Campylobacterota bacterium]